MLVTLIKSVEDQGNERYSSDWWRRIIDNYRPWVRNSARRYGLPHNFWDDFESQVFECLMRVDLTRSKNDIESYMNIKMHGIAVSILRQAHVIVRSTSISKVTITPASSINEQFDFTFGTSAFGRTDNPYDAVDLQTVVSQLPPIASLVVGLRLDGYTWLQISSKLGIPLRTIRAHMQTDSVRHTLRSAFSPVAS